jgi:hypothetical protein
MKTKMTRRRRRSVYLPREKPIVRATRTERVQQRACLNDCLGWPLKARVWLKIAKIHTRDMVNDFAYIQGDVDTEVREQMLNGVAQMAMGMDWPTYGRGLSDKQFKEWKTALFFWCVRKNMTPRGAKFEPVEIVVANPRRRRRRRSTRCQNLR